MPITPRFEPASVVERPPDPIPVHDKAGYFNPDRDQFVTFKQACAIVEACYHPQLFIVKAEIRAVEGPFPPSERKGENEHDYSCEWSNGFHQTLAAIGRLIDIKEKNKPGQGIKLTLRRIYEEMEANGKKVPWWVKDRVR